MQSSSRRSCQGYCGGALGSPIACALRKRRQLPPNRCLPEGSESGFLSRGFMSIVTVLALLCGCLCLLFIMRMMDKADQMTAYACWPPRRPRSCRPWGCCPSDFRYPAAGQGNETHLIASTDLAAIVDCCIMVNPIWSIVSLNGFTREDKTRAKKRQAE